MTEERKSIMVNGVKITGLTPDWIRRVGHTMLIEGGSRLISEEYGIDVQDAKELLLKKVPFESAKVDMEKYEELIKGGENNEIRSPEQLI